MTIMIKNQFRLVTNRVLRQNHVIFPNFQFKPKQNKKKLKFK